MNLSALGVEVYLFALAILIFAVDLIFRPKKMATGIIALIGLLIAFVLSFITPSSGTAFYGTFVTDDLSLFLKRIFILAGILASLGSLNHAEEKFSKRQGEYFLLMIFSMMGMSLAVSSRDLVLLFVSFELMSMPLYILASFAKTDEKSVEGGMKFFIFGAFSSAVILLAFSFIYGITGLTGFAEISDYLRGASDPFLLLGLILLIVGFGFKIAAVPFHMWVPDTYEGGPTPFIAFLSVAPKIAGFGILFRLFFYGFRGIGIDWLPYAAFLSGLTMVVGNILALTQTNIKRLLAYSGVGHIGYMLLGFASGTTLGIAMALFYFVSYAFSNMGAFLVTEITRRNENSDDLGAYNGLAQRSPLLALSMLLFLLSLGGIPFVVGFWAKLYVFTAAAKAGLLYLVVLGAILSVLALFYYLNIARKMYIESPLRKEPFKIPFSLSLVILISALAVVLLGFFPGTITGPAMSAATLFFGR